jgi:hypothetical protein
VVGYRMVARLGSHGRRVWRTGVHALVEEVIRTGGDRGIGEPASGGLGH